VKAVHLCCGAGGITLGFERAGIATAYAFDVEPVVVETHRANFPGAPCQLRDIREIHAGDLPPAGVWTCGIPCEPFSRAGRQLGSADPRDISLELARLINEAEGIGELPTFIFLENVPPYQDSKGAEAIRQELQTVGYAFREAVFCHADYGVPQKRLRWHLIAARGRSIPRPEPTHCEGGPDLFGLLPWIRFGAIRDGAGVAPVTAKELRFAFRHVVRTTIKHGNAFVPIIIDDDSVLPTVMSGDWRGAGRAQVRLVYESGTLRPLSFIEARRGQGFPDEFIFLGTVQQRWKSVGQAVPPPFAGAVARAIEEVMGCE
jgi:DNA (cytosine-5)-methyltransferase 1